MNKNTIRAALVAGLIGCASLGMAGAANAAVTPHQDWALGTPAAHSQHFQGHKEDEDGGGGGGESSESPADDAAPLGEDSGPAESPADSAPEQPAEEPAEAPADSAPEQPAEEPAEAPADSAPEQPADAPGEAPSDPAPEQPADAPADSAPEQPADAPAEAPADPTPADAPDNNPVADAPSQNDIDVAEDAEPVVTDPAPADASDIDQLSESVIEEMTSETTSTDEWNHEVTEWNSSWTSYDSYGRPVMLNPYNSPMQLVYTYGNAPRIVNVPPMQSVALNAPTAGVYPFTAVVKSPTGPIRQVSVGSFTGGGQQSVKPPTSNNVLVALKYAAGSSQPFRVKTLADLGDDSTVGARRVLIDGVTTAWGQWSKAPGGEREFVITKAQPLPGLGAPAEVPLPGYNVAITKR